MAKIAHYPVHRVYLRGVLAGLPDHSSVCSDSAGRQRDYDHQATRGKLKNNRSGGLILMYLPHQP